MAENKSMPFVLPLKISGWSGEHDETGAWIVDATGKQVCSTQEVEENTLEAWYAYQKIPADIVVAVNNYQQLIDALTRLTGLVRDCHNVFQNHSASWIMKQPSFLNAEAVLKAAKETS